jgi:membrane protein YqaA with SNARE-associated domain
MKDDKKKSIAEIVALPTLAAGAGSLIGGVGGGYLTHKVLKSRGIQSRLRNMPKAKRLQMMRHIQSIGAAGAGTAGAVGSYALAEHIKDQMDKRRSQEKKASLRSFLDDK